MARTRRLTQIALGCLVALWAAPAFAHVNGGMGGGLMAGFTHPLFGPDHLLAMVCVGIWGAQLGAPAIWLLPITFPLVMAFGAALGIAGVPIPAVEIIIAASVLTLGIMVALAARPPLPVALAIIAVFAIGHGWAHGSELPETANAIAFSLGFVVATGLLHALGIVIGLLIKRPAGAMAVRVAGLAVACIGVWFMYAATIQA
jgi:urease accessory protein